jgi:hypothetical protein
MKKWKKMHKIILQNRKNLYQLINAISIFSGRHFQQKYLCDSAYYHNFLNFFISNQSIIKEIKLTLNLSVLRSIKWHYIVEGITYDYKWNLKNIVSVCHPKFFGSALPISILKWHFVHHLAI